MLRGAEEEEELWCLSFDSTSGAIPFFVVLVLSFVLEIEIGRRESVHKEFIALSRRAVLCRAVFCVGP